MNELILNVLVLLSRGYLETKWNKNWRGNKSQLFAVSMNLYKYHCYFAEVLKRLDLDRNLTYFALSTRFPNKSLFHSNPLLQMLDKTAGSVYSTLICTCRTQKLQIWYYMWEQMIIYTNHIELLSQNWFKIFNTILLGCVTRCYSIFFNFHLFHVLL